MAAWAASASFTHAAIAIDMVTVGNAGNGADTTSYGAVSYGYQIGTYEITAGQYTAFLSAVAASDTYGLYNSNMWSSSYGSKIQQSGSPGSYTYSVASDYANRPVNYVSWGDAARFANWMHNGQPTGAQDLTTTENGSYYLNGATTDAQLMAVTRTGDATYVIPTENEWYKAAYHDKSAGTAATYFDYPTGTNTAPSNVLGNPTDPGNNATFWDGGYTIGSPYYRTEKGAHENSDSPYGTLDQGGNVWEWNETAVDSSSRGLRGGSFYSDSSHYLAASYRGNGSPTVENDYIGFRVANVPEPGSIALLVSGGIVGLIWWWRRK